MPNTLHLASRQRRFAAFLVDYLAMSTLMRLGGAAGKSLAVVMSQAHAGSISQMEQASQVGLLFGSAFWLSVGIFLNYGILQGLHGFSVGKYLLKLQVVGLRGRELGIGTSLLRSAAYLVSYLPGFLGFFAIFWSPKRQCWHDLICQTIVIQRPVNAASRSEVIYLPSPENRDRDIAA